MKTGLFFGKFAPLHNGHVYAITEAAKMVDVLHVVLCWDEKFQSTLTPRLKRIMTRSARMRWLMSTFSANPNIKVSFVDETPVPSYPDGFQPFADLVKESTGQSTFDFAFSSEPEYSDFFTETFPGTVHHCIDPSRSNINISATRIRSMSTNELWEYIPPAVREDFALRVTILGIESTGKSTTTIALAEKLKTHYVEEVGRTLCESEMFSSEFAMSEFDYIRIAVAHRHKENVLARTCNKVLVSDTNNFITYYSAYEVGIESLVLLNFSLEEHYDAIFVLDMDLPWVYDPLRRKGSTEERKADQERHDRTLRELLYVRDIPIPVFRISGAGPVRVSKPFEHVQELLNKTASELY